MPRLVDQLTEAKIRSLTSTGLHADGRGLYLQIRPGGARSWIYRFTLKGRTRDMGVGALADVSLTQARAKAADARAQVTRGDDPIERAKQHRPAATQMAPTLPTFEQEAEAYMDDKLRRLKNEKHKQNWRQSLRDYAYPVIGQLVVSDITTSHVLEVLRSIWHEKPETGSRVRSRMERILARATVEGRRSGPNPAAWRGHLQEALPSPTEVRPLVHYSAMDFAKVPAFMADLSNRKEVGAIALRFLILTAARTGEVIGARWSEVNWQERTWTIPAERTKTNAEHVVPLSTGALAALEDAKHLRDLSDGFVFPGAKGRGLSQMTLLALLQRRMNHDLTVHGFRSSFRDWAGDEGDVPRELAEASLAHVVGDATERSYRRRTAVEKRRGVMQAWCDFVLPPSPANVVDISEARRTSTPAA